MCLPPRPIELDGPEGPVQNVLRLERNVQQEGCTSQAWLSVPSPLICQLGRVTEVAMNVRSCVLSEEHLAKNTSGVFLIIPVARLWPISLWRAVSLRSWIVPWWREQGTGADGPSAASVPLLLSPYTVICLHAVSFFFLPEDR